jgi:hypothetical protein
MCEAHAGNGPYGGSGFSHSRPNTISLLQQYIKLLIFVGVRRATVSRIEMILAAGTLPMLFCLYASESDWFQRFPVAFSYASRTSRKSCSAVSFSGGAAAQVWFSTGSPVISASLPFDDDLFLYHHHHFYWWHLVPPWHVVPGSFPQTGEGKYRLPAN